MNPITGTLRRRNALGAAIVLVMSLSFVGNADAFYPPSGAKPDGAGGWMNPADGMCVIGVDGAGNLRVDWSITDARDCVAWTRSADGTVDLSSMDTSDECTKTATVGNDGYRHVWSTSICYDVANSRAISRLDLDNTDSMCFSKGGTVVTTGKCVAYGWIYRNRKDDNSLPVSGSGVSITHGVQATDNLGFCYASMRMTGGSPAYTVSTCPSYHNSRATAPLGEWPDCLSSTTGCQTQASYDAGLGWSWDATNSRCVYSFGISGPLNAAATNAAGTATAAGTTVDLSGITNQGDCLAAGYSWDNWLPRGGTTIKTNADLGDFAGMPAGAQIRKLDALTPVESGGGEFFSGTGFNCLKCHADQSRAYMERDKPGFIKTRHQKAGDDPSKPFQPSFTAAGSLWGLQGVQCAMCHSTAKPAQDDLIQVVPAGVVGPPAAGAPKSATGHNQTEYGAHLLDICFTCHGTAATPPTTNPASVIPVSAGDLALTAKGVPPIANQFLNSPHAKYAGSSTKVDIGDRTKYGSTFEGYVCRSAAGKLSSTTYPNAGACTGAGFTWYTTTSNGSFCYYSATSCASQATGQWFASFVTAAYPWAADTGGPGGVCAGVGIGSIVTTVYRLGSAERVPNLDTTANAACTNPGDGSATSGAAAFWVKDGETSPGIPTDTAQGNCMTCHDVHWAIADTNPEAEPFRRECVTCHSHTTGDASASGAPSIDLALINHLGGAGTPLENAATDPTSACETCHMPASAPGKSPMHLWRISTDPAYTTMGADRVNLAPDGTGWVDLNHACGQCHGGDGQAKPNVPYYTVAQLAEVAKGMHGAAGMNYPVTFTTSISGLTVDVVASVECGGPCPAFTYEWNWGDTTAHGTANPGAHTYAAPGGTFPITLTMHLASNGGSVGASTRSVTVVPLDLPPTAAGSCTFDDDTWTVSFTDASTDEDLATLQVWMDWGDGSTRTKVAPGGSASRTYIKPGSFTVTETAIDKKLQSNSRTCTVVTPAYFTIAGAVTTGGTTPVRGALLTLRRFDTNVAVATAVSAADGTYTLRNIRPGRYRITATRAVYQFAPIPDVTVGPSLTGQNFDGTVSSRTKKTPGATRPGVR